MELTLRVGVLMAGGWTQVDVARYLGITTNEVRRALNRIDQVKEDLEPLRPEDNCA